MFRTNQLNLSLALLCWNQNPTAVKQHMRALVLNAQTFSARLSVISRIYAEAPSFHFTLCDTFLFFNTDHYSDVHIQGLRKQPGLATKI